MDESKKRALDSAILQIEKQFGKGSIMKLGSGTTRSVDVVPTGCLTLDIALGIGGMPRGRIVEIFGPESSGKTTVSLHVIAEMQKMNGIAAFIDAEHALDPVYAEKLGVNVNDLYVSQPDNGEQALDIAECLVRSAAVDLIVVDSVAALTPRAEIEGDMGDAHVGLQARLMSQALRKLAAIVHKSNCCIIFINQLRESGRYVRKSRNHPGRQGSEILFQCETRREKSRSDKGRVRYYRKQNESESRQKQTRASFQNRRI